MAEVVNLNRFRKQKTRETREAEAAANRVKYGRTGAEKRQERLEEERRQRELEGKRIEGED